MTSSSSTSGNPLPPVKKRKVDRHSGLLTSDNVPSPKKPVNRKHAADKKLPKEKTPDSGSEGSSSNLEQQQKSSEHAPSPTRPSRQESVVWDIESLAGKDDKPATVDIRTELGSQNSDATSPRNGGTVVLNTLATNWNTVGSSTIPERLAESDDHLQERPDFVKRTVSPSLCPSQSVSQAMHDPLRSRTPKRCRSKYFRQLQQSPAEAKEPLAMDVDMTNENNADQYTAHLQPGTCADDSDVRPMFGEDSSSAFLNDHITAHRAQDYTVDTSFISSAGELAPYSGPTTEVYSGERWPPADYDDDDMAFSDADRLGETLPLTQSDVDIHYGSDGYDVAYPLAVDLDYPSDVRYDYAFMELESGEPARSAHWDTYTPATLDSNSYADFEEINALPDLEFQSAMPSDADGSTWEHESTRMALPSAATLEEWPQYEIINSPTQAEPFFHDQTPQCASSDVAPSDTPSEVSEPHVMVGSLKVPTAYQVEEDVAKHLRGHWLPQRW